MTEVPQGGPEKKVLTGKEVEQILAQLAASGALLSGVKNEESKPQTKKT